MTLHVDVGLTVGSLSVAVAFDADAATPLCIVGPNGAGKTSLLRAITGAYVPHRGRVVLGDRILFDHDAGVDIAPEGRRVGYVPQGYGLFPHLSVADNVGFGLLAKIPKVGRTARETAVHDMLAHLGCEGLAARRPSTLSGGEQQKVALARALVAGPELLILDEPLAALDAAARQHTRAFLAQQLQALQVPALVVTHEARDVTALDARVLVLENGIVVQSGDAAAMAASPASPFVAEVFGP